MQKLLDWSKEQLLVSHQPPSNDCIPFKLQKGYGRVGNNLVVIRPNLTNYTVYQEQLTPLLQENIAEFIKFRSAKHYPQRKAKAVTQSTSKTEYGNLLRLLGWFVNIRGVDIETLSLEYLIPRLPVSATKEEIMEMTYYVESWLCDFIIFMENERQVRSLGSIQSYLAMILALSKYHYLSWNDDDNYAQIPIIRMIRSRMNQISKDLKNQESVADMSKKWMNLPDFMENCLEPLRLCCRRRLFCGSERSLSSVSWSLEGYLIVGNLCYMPPRRQRELRDLRLATSCPVKRPANLPPSGWIHPLPAERLRGNNVLNGYLHRTADGRWFRDMTPESYKTGYIYGHQELEIPNISLPEGYCFYDYLEMWLYGYCYGADGSIRPVKEESSSQGRIMESRSVFNPTHDFVFAQKNGKKFGAANLGKFFTNWCHAMTGFRVTPHLLRDMFTTHFLDEGASDDLIHSLAYAMGHSIDTLRKIYDRRRPAQKRRPIEKAVQDLVQQSLHLGS